MGSHGESKSASAKPTAKRQAASSTAKPYYANFNNTRVVESFTGGKMLVDCDDRR